MRHTDRLACHIAAIRTFSSKVLVIVDPDTRVDPAISRDLYERLTDLGQTIWVHHCDTGDTSGFSSIFYAEFDTEEEAALFKLTYL